MRGEVDQGDTACKTQDATDYIKQVERKRRIVKKRKSARNKMWLASD